MYYTEPKITVLARPTFAEPEHLPVQWIGDSTDGERLAEFAGRLCYMSQKNPAGRTTREYLENIKKQGHGSVLEHANYSLLLEGVSRSLTHELIRHRAGFAYCMSGDTVIQCADGNAENPTAFTDRTLEELYELAQSTGGDEALGKLRLRCFDERSGTFATDAIAAITCSGLKPVFRVELADGRSIVATKEHRFLTPAGWRRLEEIVRVDDGADVEGDGQLVVYPRSAGDEAERSTRRLDPPGLFAARAVASGAERALGASARIELDFDEAWQTVGVTLVRDVVALATDPRREISLDAARRLEADAEIGDHLETPLDLAAPEAQRIVRVSPAGEQMTYDIEMAGPNHNFVANGIVTHNSQLSQRYVDESQAHFVVPPAIVGEAQLEASWREQIEAAQRAYVSLVEQLMERYGWVADRVHRRKMAREAARAVLPNATETKIVVTANARAWRTMLELRAGEGAELEIRRLAVAVIRLLQREAPAFFSDFEIYAADDRREAARIGYHKV